jgi:hypothetical protein
MTIATARLALSAVSSVVIALLGTAPVAAQAPGLPDPTQLPGRPGPGTPGPGPATPGRVPGPPPRDNSARPPGPEKGTAVVRGRVVAADTGLPLRRARVMLGSQGRGQPRMTYSEADGSFVFDQLAPGRYDVRVSKPRYVDTSVGARRPGGPGRPFELADGQTFGGLVVALPAAGVITGRVVDDIGDVVTGAAVVAMRYRTINGERQLVPMGVARQTDDMGVFRLYGLPPGAYYVSARGEESQRFALPEMQEATVSGFAPTYYPGTTVASDAQPVQVVAGAEVSADVTLVPARLTTISGYVVDASGARASGGFLMVYSSDMGSRGMMWGGGGGQIKPDGTFVIPGVAPGEYTITGQAMFGQQSMFQEFSPERSRTASASVVVNGEPVTNVRLGVQDPVRIPVNVTFDDAGAERPERVFVSAGTTRGGGGTAAMRDGRLTLEVVPGSYRLFAGAGPTSGSMTQTWFVKRLAYRGRDVGDDSEVELTAEPGARIDVVLTTRTSVVTGGVTDGSGKPTIDYTAIVFPEDRERTRRGTYRRVQAARPDQQGRFRVEALPPGEYLAVAIPDVEIEDLYDADFLDGLRGAAKSFTVADSGTVTLALTLAPLP